MSQESRRTLLKGLALTLPAAWTTPVVQSVVLPAHAQTSPASSETSPECSASPGCYVVSAGSEPESFSWPGGAGPEVVDVFANADCDDSGSSSPALVVVADSLEAAQSQLTCDSGFEVVEVPTEPSPAEGCSFFACVVVE